MSHPPGKPANLLVIISDEHRRDALGCMGHPVVKTPNLDQLAERGTVFCNAYTPSPMCVPARASLASGTYVHNTGHWDSATPYHGKPHSWMAQLRDQGREVVSIGKLHFRSDKDDNGFSHEILPMHVVGGVGWAIGLLREDPPHYSQAAELAADVGIGTSTYTDYDLEITAATEHWLESKHTAEKPWAAFVSLVSPHYPLTCPEEYYNLYNPMELELPIGYRSTAAPEHKELQNIARFFDYGSHFDEHKIREAIAAYYGLTSFMDNCVGRIINAMDRSGQTENTVVVYISDHGEMLGDHGFWTKQVMYEQSAGVPMIAAGPGFPIKHRVTTAASLIDIAATAVDIGGNTSDKVSNSLAGISLRQLANQKDNPHRTILSEYHDGGSTTGTFMIRWENWKYIYYVGHPPQLFDLVEDPNELNDLGNKGEAESTIQQTLQEGERRLREICNPEEVNQRCFNDQKQRIEALGGREACINSYVFNHTPTPAEQSKVR
ncbi:choline-sulfatase [Chromatiales bacterium (ex Bugula neritina AB1)]|nr:choline-sulfatase [Chromatiales bacterium (ex Bugula neritina AB1)]